MNYYKMNYFNLEVLILLLCHFMLMFKKFSFAFIFEGKRQQSILVESLNLYYLMNYLRF